MSVKKTVFCFPDAVGGVFSVVNNLVRYSGKSSAAEFIAYSDVDLTRQKVNDADAVVRPSRFDLNGYDNLYFTARNFKAKLPANVSCIVATDVIELQMVHLCRLNVPVVYIVLGDFGHYYNIAETYEGIIDTFICISKEIEQKLIALLPSRKNDIKQLYFPTPPVEQKRQAFNASPNLKVIYVARLDDGKNPFILNDIDDILVSKSIKIDWVIVGDGPLRQPMQQKVGNKDNFSFTGFVSNDKLHKLYLNNDVFILPSESEGLPVSLIEAMKTGLVPIVSDITGGNREVVSEGHNGFLCKYHDAEKFASHIALLSQNRGLLSKMASTAINSAEKLFDPNTNCKNYWDVFEQAATANHVKRFKKIPLSNLDIAWLPNSIVRYLRSLRNKNAAQIS